MIRLPIGSDKELLIVAPPATENMIMYDLAVHEWYLRFLKRGRSTELRDYLSSQSGPNRKYGKTNSQVHDEHVNHAADAFHEIQRPWREALNAEVPPTWQGRVVDLSATWMMQREKIRFWYRYVRFWFGFDCFTSEASTKRDAEIRRRICSTDSERTQRLRFQFAATQIWEAGCITLALDENATDTSAVYSEESYFNVRVKILKIIESHTAHLLVRQAEIIDGVDDAVNTLAGYARTKISRKNVRLAQALRAGNPSDADKNLILELRSAVIEDLAALTPDNIGLVPGNAAKRIAAVNDSIFTKPGARHVPIDTAPERGDLDPAIQSLFNHENLKFVVQQANLSEFEYKAFRLEAQGLTRAEIALKLRKPAASVQKWLGRARSKIRAVEQ